MSNVNIKRLIENIRSGTNIYTPLLELVVNAIHATEQKGDGKGSINIQVIRSQGDFIDRLGVIDGFIVRDNGIGFTEDNRKSFDTVYSDQKAHLGGKGFGRFSCLKYYDHLEVESTFVTNSILYDRLFKMGKEQDIIINEKTSVSKNKHTGTVVKIYGLKSDSFPHKNIDNIAHVIVARLLLYFLDKDIICPDITLCEENDPNNSICLNDYVISDDSKIVELPIERNIFTLQAHQEAEKFQVRIFKFYGQRKDLGAPKNEICLIAHRRNVVSTSLSKYAPEFEELFCDNDIDGISSKEQKFCLKVYVFGEYLNQHVSLERSEFNFPPDTDLFSSISQSQIEETAAEIAQSVLENALAKRRADKQELINNYISNGAPWHKTLAKEVDFSDLGMKPSNTDIELYLQRKKHEKETETLQQVTALLKKQNSDKLAKNVSQVVKRISATSKNDLAHYVCMRKLILDIFEKSLEIDANCKYKSEGELHDIIMPRKKDTESLNYDDHNLWILDERLNFTSYISSDKSLDGSKNSGRPDIIAYDQRVAFRGENETSNPITIFEFKRPQRDDFANESSSEDPITQIIQYVNHIRDGEFRTPTGLNIRVNETTPFYGYVICDLTPKVNRWLLKIKDFKPMPDGLGWFQWHDSGNLYIEVLSWTKLLKDAKMRNKAFFKKLGIG
ncbi:ATP-binding protein [Bartonella sp. DGB2]|uniref:ATP-binding protein n=1 Tax=Bartonella sp. DGB2 TaxID=3388426 RepID=UPI00398FFDB2